MFPSQHSPSPAAKSPADPQTGSVTGGGWPVCVRLGEQIEQALAQGLSVQRIYQDLVVKRAFAGSYFAVRRFVVRLVGKQKLPFRRM